MFIDVQEQNAELKLVFDKKHRFTKNILLRLFLKQKNCVNFLIFGDSLEIIRDPKSSRVTHGLGNVFCTIRFPLRFTK